MHGSPPAPIIIDGRTFVPEDPGTRGPEDARPCDAESRCRICGHTRPCPDEVKHVERDWFFTFGSGHTYHGESLARAFVRFHGTALEARRQMYEVFGTAFSHQYATEEEAGVAQFGLTELKLEATDG